jgi:predicted alpha/beta-hydrolase family hydrolase
VLVRGDLHHAATPSGDALVLTHGASGNCNAVLLIALAEGFSASGLNVLCCDLPSGKYLHRAATPSGDALVLTHGALTSAPKAADISCECSLESPICLTSVLPVVR